MDTPLSEKSSNDEIRERFDGDVERFSDLSTGQAATIDAPLTMELITGAAVASTRRIAKVLDIGCGAGNNAIRLARAYEGVFDCDLCDLSLPMLERARERLGSESPGEIGLHQGDFRSVPLQEGAYDIILAGAVLHHLRFDTDWEQAFAKIFRLLRPGGSVWITDLVAHEHAPVHGLMWRRYGGYLEALGGREYREQVFAYIDKEDSPKPVTYQLDLLRKVGFKSVNLLHKNSCFAAFGAVKSAT